MAPTEKAPKDGDRDSLSPQRGGATIQDRIAAFAMLDGMKDATQAQKTLRLSQVGFSNNEIASMLQTSAAVVSQNLYAERRKAEGKNSSPVEARRPKSED